mmetsp:Transcript_16835/g.36440  ORF Transcript_16835/g.36440 Transcript_16835/m.36440 type:complete len:89 (+) Transcript_16835:360-626(+)
MSVENGHSLQKGMAQAGKQAGHGSGQQVKLDKAPPHHHMLSNKSSMCHDMLTNMAWASQVLEWRGPPGARPLAHPIPPASVSQYICTA